MKTFKASLDKSAIFVTAAVLLLFIFIIGYEFFVWHTPGIPKYFSIFLFFLIYMGTYVFSPVSYSVTDKELIVNRIFLSVHIPRENIVSAEWIDSKRTYRSFRTMGVGGLFGYYGRFSNADLGNMIWYTTRRDRTILIRTVRNEKLILSPDEPALFIIALNQE